MQLPGKRNSQESAFSRQVLMYAPYCKAVVRLSGPSLPFLVTWIVSSWAGTSHETGSTKLSAG